MGSRCPSWDGTIGSPTSAPRPDSRTWPTSTPSRRARNDPRCIVPSRSGARRTCRRSPHLRAMRGTDPPPCVPPSLAIPPDWGHRGPLSGGSTAPEGVGRPRLAHEGGDRSRGWFNRRGIVLRYIRPDPEPPPAPYTDGLTLAANRGPAWWRNRHVARIELDSPFVLRPGWRALAEDIWLSQARGPEGERLGPVPVSRSRRAGQPGR